MTSNLDSIKADLDRLIAHGEGLFLAMQAEALPEQFQDAIAEKLGGSTTKAKKVIAGLPSFADGYQTWYSEAKGVVKQLLPDRLPDFVRHYERPRSRKEITNENYTIEDFLQGLSVTRGWEKQKVVGPEAAVPHFRQQLNMLKAAKARFASSLFDIRQVVRADLFDSEIDSARELLRNGFVRAAGAVAGVVLEKHLSSVCAERSIKLKKRLPAISDLSAALKEASVIDVATWRFVQHLADIRNLCDHNRQVEPTKDQGEDLIAGVAKVIKTIF